MRRWTALLISGLLACAALLLPVGRPASATDGVPKVVVIVMENEQYTGIVGSASAPYMNSLIPQGMLFTDYHAVISGSAPNYRATTAGTTTSPPPVPENIFRAFDQASRTWLGFEESMAGNCGVTDNQKVPGSTKITLYTPRHDPALMFRGNESCATHDVPLTSDAQLTALPEFSYIVPNECDDMHTPAAGAGCPSYFGTVAGANPIQMGDNWLAHVVPALLSDPDATVIITFDEGLNVSAQRIYTLEVGAGVTPGVDAQRYDHYGLLAGLYGFYGLGPAPNAAATATPLPIAPDADPRLSVDIEGSGNVTSDPSGIACGTAQTGTCAAGFAAGTPVTLTATPGGGGATFEGWSGDCSGMGDCMVSMDAGHSVTATFGPLFTLTVDPPVNGSVHSDVGVIDCPGVCSEDFVNGTEVTLTAQADPGYTFGAWAGDCDGVLTPSCPVAMRTDRSASVTFDATPQETLTVATDGTAPGSVTSDVGGIDCPAACSTDLYEGQVVTLTAHPGPNVELTGWSGACTGTSSTCAVTMNGPQSVRATFDPAPSAFTLADDDPAVTYNGWRGVVDAAANGGAYRVSGVVNDKARWKSTVATSLTWTAHTGPDGGKAGVSIDGRSKGTVDLYAAAPGTIAQTYGGLSLKAHTIVVRVTSGKNPASTGQSVSIDAFASGTKLVSESDPGITYDAWNATASSHALGGSYRSSTVSSAMVSVTFTGTAVDWITCKGPGFGKASVILDGTSMGTVDLYKATQAWQAALSYGPVDAGSHTLIIQVLGTKDAASNGTKVCVDGFTIYG